METEPTADDRRRRDGPRLAGCVAALLVAGLLAAAPAPAEPPPLPAAGAEEVTAWPVGVPEQHAADPDRLAAAVERIAAMDGVYSLLVAHGGELVVERYFRDGFREKPHNLKSASKSVLSALVGIAVGEGLIDLDRPIVELLPSVTVDDPRKEAITVRHLVTMTSGLEPTSYDTYGEWTAGRDWVRGALALPLVAEPGSRFQYSTGNSHLLSAVLAAATGTSTREYAERRLFGPLGIELQGWARDPQGVHVGGNDLALTPRAMARFGQLFLDGGRWRGSQIVPADWIEESTRTGEIGLHEVYGTYGRLWWTDLVYEGAFIAVGYGGQYIYVSPPHGCVVVVTSTLIAKGEEWTAELFAALRDGVLASFAPAADYYAALGRPAADPALESLERALVRAEAEIAALKGAAPERTPELPARGRTSARVNLRRGPGTETARIKLLERGASVELVERTDGWLLARVDGDEGWLHADYVEVENGSWRPLASALRHDLAAFSEAVRERLPEGLPEPDPAPSAGPATPAGAAAADRRVAGLEERLAVSTRSAAELESGVGKLEGDLREQQQALGEARADGRRLAGELEAARQRITALEARLEAGEADDRLAPLAAELAEAGARIADLEGELAVAAASRRSLEAELAAGTTERQRLAGELAVVVGERTALAAALERQSAVADHAAATAASSRVALAAELETARRGIAGLEERLATSQATQGDLERRLALLADERDQLRDSLVEAAESGSSLTGELEAARARIAGFEDHLSRSREADVELADRLAGLAAERDQLRVSLAEAAESRRSLTGELEAARARIAGLEERLSDSQAAQADLEGRLAALATAAEASGSESAAAAAETRVRLETELGEARQRIAALERTLGEAEVARAELEDRLSRRQREADRDLSLARSEIGGRLEAAHARIAVLEESLGTAVAGRAELEARLERLARSHAEGGSRLAESEEARQQLAAELQAAGERLAELETEARDDAVAGAELEQRLAAMQRDAEARATAFDRARAGQDELAGRLRAADARIVGLEDRLRTAQRERSRLLAQMAELGTQGGSRSQAAAALGDELRAATARIQALEGQLQAAERAGLRLGDNLKSLRAEWEERTLELAEATRARAELDARLDGARRRIADLEARLERGAEERTGLAAQLAAAQQLAATDAEDRRRAEADRTAMAAEVAAGRQETIAQLSAASGQIEALERLLIGERQRSEAMASALEATRERVAALESRLAEDPTGGTAAVAVTEPPAAAIPATGAATGSVEAAAALVRAWAAAWSSQDPERYLSFYAASFEPAGGQSRQAWEEHRRLLLERPRFIRVEIGSLEVELAADGGRAQARFHQLYRSDSRQLSTGKLLELVREQGAWRIQRETTTG